MRLGLGLGLGRGGINHLAGYAVGGVYPSYVLDFERGFYQTPWTLTRAGAATYWDGASLHSVSADVKRYVYTTDGTRALLLEGSTTNYVQRSSHTAAYPWSTATTHNGITATMVESGTLNGVPYADYSLTGTATSTTAEPFVSASYSRTASSIGQTWTASLHHQLVSGVWPSGVVVNAGVIQENSSNLYLAGTFTGSAPSTSIGRTTATATLAAATMANVRSNVDLRGMTAGVTTFTGQVIRLFGWQLEQNASATSLIQSLSGAATTRAADTIAPIPLTGLSAGYTLVVAGQVDAVDGSYDRIVQMDQGTGDTRQLIHYEKSSGAVYCGAYYGGVSQTTAVGGVVAYGSPFVAAFAIGADHFQAAVNGAASTLDASVQYAVPAYMRLAQGVSGDKPARLLLTKVAIYPALLTQAQLEGVTA